MRLTHLLCIFILAGLALGLTGCECEAESDDELCGDERCGLGVWTDNCGDEREVDCGACPDGLDCQDNQCVCPAESDDELCAGHDLNCGTQTLVDSCGDDREVDCGDCSEPDECMAGQCQCITEDDPELCLSLGYQCGTDDVTDRCGDPRSLDCGDCPTGDACIDFQCDCDAESDDQLCAEADVQCGELVTQDRCQMDRDIDCGSCSEPDQCIDGQCQCVGESDDDLCDSLGDVCGTQTVTDQCGDERTVECQPCPAGDSALGAVTDASDGALIDGASVDIFEWPPPGGSHYTWFWAPGYRSDDADWSFTTSSGENGVNFELTDGDAFCTDVDGSGLDDDQIYRIVIDHPDYQETVFYRPLERFRSDLCPDDCLTGADSRCFVLDFELWPTDTTHAQPPNLFVDPREMADHAWQCTLLPDDSPEPEIVGFRARLGAANLGPGPFHLQASPDGGDDGQVLQHIQQSDGSTDSVVVPSGTFEYEEDHNHTHFVDWFRMSLIEQDEDCLDVDTRSDDCVTDGGLKISYCLHDLDPFDGDIMDLFGGVSAIFLDPPVCDTTEQGVTQGWRDTYAKGLPGQVIIVGTPDVLDDLGPQWLEAEVDPEQMLVEKERHGNIARIPISIPDDPCSDSTKILDCSMPRSDYTTTAQFRQCRDYLRHVGLE